MVRMAHQGTNPKYRNKFVGWVKGVGFRVALGSRVQGWKLMYPMTVMHYRGTSLIRPPPPLGPP